ncbi:hypothetical protein VTJ83DRAFT_6388 [Remersonia thermophila]|uniref:Rhodopsin domain-containing protein n=1 Tax=Remersonia thermophila TaxID=72144 RepID=A0ABR4D4M7_9PEZI
MAEPAAADLSRGPVLLSFSLATASFALATTFVRLHSRRRLRGGFESDDYASGAATVVAFLGTIFGVLEGGAADPARALQFHTLGRPWCLVSSTISKVSICLFFSSLLGRARHWRALLAYLILIIGVVNAAYGLAFYLQCRPLEKVWNPLVAGDCLGPTVQANFGYAQGAFSVFSWVFLALFPVLMLREMLRRDDPSWPFYTASVLSFACGVFVIVRTARASQTTSASNYSLHFFYASLMANLEQNIRHFLLLDRHRHRPRPKPRHGGGRRSRTRSRAARPRDPYGSATSSTTLSSTSSIVKGKAPHRPSHGSTATHRSTKPTRSGGDRAGAPPSRTDSTRSLARSLARRPSERSPSRAGSRADLHRGGSQTTIRRKEVGSGSTNRNGNTPGSSVLEDGQAGWDRDLERGQTGGRSQRQDDDDDDDDDNARQEEGDGPARHPRSSNHGSHGPRRLGKAMQDYGSDASGSASDTDTDTDTDADSDAERVGTPRLPASRSASRRGRRDRASNLNDDSSSTPFSSSSSLSSSSSEDDSDSGSDDDDDGDDDSDYDSDRGSAISLEAWPRGIIKTVSVEVTEEVNEEYVAAMAAAAAQAGGNPFVVAVPPPARLHGAPPIPPPPRGHARGLSGRSTTSVTAGVLVLVLVLAVASVCFFSHV